MVSVILAASQNPSASSLLTIALAHSLSTSNLGVQLEIFTQLRASRLLSSDL